MLSEALRGDTDRHCDGCLRFVIASPAAARSTAGSSRSSRRAKDRTRAPALGDCGSRDLPPVIGAAGALGERRSRWIDRESGRPNTSGGRACRRLQGS
jgi:hypothetical protein